MATAWKKSCFILSQRSDFHMINSLSIWVCAFLMQMLTSLSVDEILLPRYVTGLLVSKSCHLKRKWLHLDKCCILQLCLDEQQGTRIYKNIRLYFYSCWWYLCVLHTHNVGNLKYTTFTKLVQVRNFITFELKVFWHEERERHTIFLCWLFLHRQLSTQPTRGSRSAQIRLALPSSESRLSCSEAGTQLTAFSQIPKILSPRFWCVMSLTSPGHNSYLRFLFWHLWMTHPLRARAKWIMLVTSYDNSHVWTIYGVACVI